ncbi:TetR/AcrR family transcriptional regulator [Sciscionella marina]|uniref:TetR/AcrR family transcriptional regulator n=1 Tax=Sciscionella marina TaxID=508770 RepID=UPI0003663CE4|nr:TetR/AcrR family transcriptional regulator [Sciscionella marina]
MSESSRAHNATKRKTRTARRRDELILDALEQLLVATPLRDLGVEQIAEAAGITRTRFYHYYKSKHEAYAALLTRVRDKLLIFYDTEDSWFQRPESTRPRASMKATIRAVVDFWLEHGAVMREGADLWNSVAEARSLWHDVIAQPVERMTRAIERERQRGIAPDGPEAGQLAHNLIWHGERMLFLSLIDAPGMMSVDDLVESATTVWMRTIYLADDPPTSKGTRAGRSSDR